MKGIIIKWAIVLVIIVIGNVVVKPLLVDTNQVAVSNQLAVAQLEPSDANYIALRTHSNASSMVDRTFKIGTILIIFVTLYTDRKRIMDTIDTAID